MNIRRSADKWQGQVLPQRAIVRYAFKRLGSFATVGKSGEGAFCQFYSMEWGWRAAFVILCRTYYGKYGLKTIRGIVTRWAPPKENNTEAYIRHVSDYTGIGPDRDLGDPQTHPTNWLLIGYAMAVVECGKALPAVPMLQGFALAIEK